MKDSRVILVVEGDDAIWSVIKDALPACADGYAVMRLDSAELAEMLAGGASVKKPGLRSAHALILDDDYLGGQTVQILSQLRTHEFLARVPAVILIGREDERHISECQTMGASICILKSGGEEALRETLVKLGDFLAVVQVSQS
ncbi:MAG TPA: hypothetical protein VLH60_03175 [Sedimentisphaerales bacterium]|nr:hypothetical protein [Sedimentisphaerales bacterium]